MTLPLPKSRRTNPMSGAPGFFVKSCAAEEKPQPSHAGFHLLRLRMRDTTLFRFL